MSVWIERGAERGSVGGCWGFEFMTGYHHQQQRSSWDLIIHCSRCLHHNKPQLVARWGLPVLECVHVWKVRSGLSATKSAPINSWENINEEGAKRRRAAWLIGSGVGWLICRWQVMSGDPRPGRHSHSPTHPSTQAAIFALLLCLSVPVLSEKSFSFSLFVLLRLFSHHSTTLPSPPLQLEQLVSPAPPLKIPHRLNTQKAPSFLHLLQIDVCVCVCVDTLLCWG